MRASHEEDRQMFGGLQFGTQSDTHTNKHKIWNCCQYGTIVNNVTLPWTCQVAGI